MAVSSINQHEIFSFEYTHHLLLLLLLSLLETPQKELGRLSEAFWNCGPCVRRRDTVPDERLVPVYVRFFFFKLQPVWRLEGYLKLLSS